MIEDNTYTITRSWSDGRDRKVIKESITLAEVEEYYEDEITSGTNDDGTKWFDSRQQD